jgi:hypothetical protein
MASVGEAKRPQKHRLEVVEELEEILSRHRDNKDKSVHGNSQAVSMPE